MVGLAAFAGIALGACQGDDSDGNSEASLAVRNACDDYCEKATECNDNVDQDNCYSDCLDNMGNCQVDEQDEAIDKLNMCSDEACNEFVGCTIEVGAQCYFGI